MHVLPLSIVLFHIVSLCFHNPSFLPNRSNSPSPCATMATGLSGTGRLTKASDFKGAQGVMIREGRFLATNAGSRDLQATGKWGPRYVTWVKLTAAWLD